MHQQCHRGRRGQAAKSVQGRYDAGHFNCRAEVQQ